MSPWGGPVSGLAVRTLTRRSTLTATGIETSESDIRYPMARIDRRRFLGASLATLLGGCANPGGTSGGTPGDSPGGTPGGTPGGIVGRGDPGPVPERNIDAAVARLDALVAELMAQSGVPGLAVAVVRGESMIYAKGFGTRLIGTTAPVDADTVFQLASVSKSVGATAVAREVGLGRVAWDTPMRELLPWFALADADVTRRLTVGDLYAHRSGLPDHAGDRLEDMGFGQREVLTRLRYLPLRPFRSSYAYTNFGLTAAGLGVATAAGVDWASLVEQAIYVPLGMTRTSSRFGDFATRPNRVTGHRQVAGRWLPVDPPRMPDAQAPAASVTSSVNDLAKWLAMLLGDGRYAGRRIVAAAPLAATHAPQIEVAPATGARPASYYGYGFNVGTTTAGRASYGHSGGFAMGAATAFKVLPTTGIGLVALTNGYPIGVPEILSEQFFDLIEHGAIQRDWGALIRPFFAKMNAPEGTLVGVPRPTAPKTARPLADYAGSYRNAYHGPLRIDVVAGALQLTLGPAPVQQPLAHWDGDVFTFTLDNENAPPGTISRASFGTDRVTLEYYDEEGLGTFVR